MSAIQYLTSGGMANLAGDLPDTERAIANDIVKLFGEVIRSQARVMQMPASLLKVNQCAFLYVAKDTSGFHFVFAEAPGTSTRIVYRDISSQGRFELQSLSHQVRIDFGEVVWAFSTPAGGTAATLNSSISQLGNQYLESVLQAQRKPEKSISNEALASPEIASGLEKFRLDHPIGKKTAFVIMQFGNTKPHLEIITCIKSILDKHGIHAMRADDKQYMDDLFPNIKVYMHACDFGIAVFDRITEDDFNPNVSLEVGYMLGMQKNVLLLKDHTLKSLQTDLTGRLYKPFDTNNIAVSMTDHITQWLSDKGQLA